jgi:hypothetical protein
VGSVQQIDMYLADLYGNPINAPLAEQYNNTRLVFNGA